MLPPNWRIAIEPLSRSKLTLPRVIAALLLALVAVLAGGAAYRESVAVDELAHIGAGVSYWQKFDLRMNPEHPPLVKLLAAAPLAARGVHADYSGHIWTWSGLGLVQPNAGRMAVRRLGSSPTGTTATRPCAGRASPCCCCCWRPAS